MRALILSGVVAVLGCSGETGQQEPADLALAGSHDIAFQECAGCGESIDLLSTLHSVDIATNDSPHGASTSLELHFAAETVSFDTVAEPICGDTSCALVVPDCPSTLHQDPADSTVAFRLAALTITTSLLDLAGDPVSGDLCVSVTIDFDDCYSFDEGEDWDCFPNTATFVSSACNATIDIG